MTAPAEGTRSAGAATRSDVRDHLQAGSLVEDIPEDDPLHDGAGDVPVVAPRSVDEIQDLLRTATREGWRVRVAGNGGALPPDFGKAAADVVLTTRALTNVHSYSPADLTFTADAGVALGALDATTRQSGQWLPLDPAGRARRTLGGVLSTGDQGPLVAGFGVPRDHVLGLTLVTGDGRLLELGGKVVKNVAGYDLVKLAVGSRGSLGVITSATLRLHPVPSRDVSLIFHHDDVAAAAITARSLAGAPVQLAALELLAPATGPAGWDESAHAAAGGSATVAARVLSSPEALADTEAMLAAAAGRGPDDRFDDDDSRRFFARLEGAGLAAATSVRVGAAPSRLEELLGRCGWAHRMAAHATVGAVRVFLDADEAAEDGALAHADRLAGLRDAVNELGGWFRVTRVEGGPWPRPEPTAVGATRELVDGIVAAFDPAGVLGKKG